MKLKGLIFKVKKQSLYISLPTAESEQYSYYYDYENDILCTIPWFDLCSKIKKNNFNYVCIVLLWQYWPLLVTTIVWLVYQMFGLIIGIKIILGLLKVFSF